MKICTKCKQTKPLSEFHKDRSTKDNHRPDCKICSLKRIKEYSQTERGKAAHKRYYQSKKGKITRRTAQRRFRILHPEFQKAEDAVKSAIRAGKMPRPDSLKCLLCGEPAKQYHHHKSYAPEHQLNVIPVCQDCHKKVHHKEKNCA